MNRLSAHIGYLYTELPLIERVGAAARDGFTSIEYPEPFSIDASELRQRLDDVGLTFTLLSSGMGDPARHERGLAALRGRENDFREGFQRALDYAQIVGAAFIHPMAGIPSGGLLDAGESYRSNLGWAINACEGSGVSVLIETITLPGYYLGNLQEAMDVQDSCKGRLSLLLDTYHATQLGEDPANWITNNAARIGHIHIADHPGRHEPGSGSINFEAILRALDCAGYRGAIGFEFIPSASTEQSLGFLPAWKNRVGSSALPRQHQE